MLKVFRAVVEVDVVDGRVGGLLSVPLVDVRADVGFGADVEVGRFVVVVPEAGRLLAAVGLFLAGEVVTFSLAASGLVTGSSPPERSVESTGVAGVCSAGAGSAGVDSVGTGSGGVDSAGPDSASAASATTGSAVALTDSGSAGGATGSSVDAMM